MSYTSITFEGVALLAVALIILSHIIHVSVLNYPKPTWCTFRDMVVGHLKQKNMWNKGIGFRSDADAHTLEADKSTKLFQVFVPDYDRVDVAGHWVGDGPRNPKRTDGLGGQGDKSHSKAVSIMRKEGTAWMGPNMAKDGFLYISRCAYNSPKFPWTECLAAVGIDLEQFQKKITLWQYLFTYSPPPPPTLREYPNCFGACKDPPCCPATKVSTKPTPKPQTTDEKVTDARKTRALLTRTANKQPKTTKLHQ